MRINLILLGIALILMGIGIITYASISESKKVEYGFIGIIGPFPIIISSSKDLLILSLIIFLVILLVLFIFFLYL